MNIPKSFQLMGMTVRIKVETLPESDWGQWSMQDQTIRIDKTLPLEGQLQTFWHEAMHACLDSLSYDKLSRDEAFVDRMARCLAQIEQTRK